VNLLSMAEVNQIYSYTRAYKIYLHEVSHGELENFSMALLNFQRIANDDYWHRLLSPLRSYGFRSVSTPLPFHYPQGYAEELLTGVLKYSEGCESIYPQLALDLEDLLESFIKLATSGNSPYHHLLCKLCKENGWERVALVVRGNCAQRDVEKFLKEDPSLEGVQLVPVRSLRANKRYDAIILLGPMKWFPEYIYRSPRAQEIHSIKYPWIRDDWELSPVFINTTSYSQERVIRKPCVSRSREQYVTADDLLPRLDWSYIVERGIGRLKTMDRDTYDPLEEVDAHLVLLEDCNGVFIKTDDDNLLVIDPYNWDSDEDSFLQKKVSINELKAGTFLLLRTSGGEFDYLRRVARGFMEKKAEELEETQWDWKMRLQRAMENNGTHESCRILQDLGANNPSTVNLRTWISDKNIKPQKYEDFRAIMRFIGLEHLTDEYWNNARIIDSAHRRAGHRIRKLLLAEVIDADIDHLEEVGIKEFYLDDEDAGSFTAFRVHHVSPESYSISASGIGVPFESEDSAWAI
jgi:hypothetical protein